MVFPGVSIERERIGLKVRERQCMRTDLYSTGTDSRIISCTVRQRFAQRAMGTAIWKIPHVNPDFIVTIHSAFQGFRGFAYGQPVQESV
jgi:hypothetical protein